MGKEDVEDGVLMGIGAIDLDRKIAELRIWPAINLGASGTRREELLLSAKELEAAKREGLRKAMDFSDECGAKPAPMLAVALGSLAFIGGIAFLAAKAFKQKK